MVCWEEKDPGALPASHLPTKPSPDGSISPRRNRTQPKRVSPPLRGGEDGFMPSLAGVTKVRKKGQEQQSWEARLPETRRPRQGGLSFWSSLQEWSKAVKDGALWRGLLHRGTVGAEAT